MQSILWLLVALCLRKTQAGNAAWMRKQRLVQDMLDFSYRISDHQEEVEVYIDENWRRERSLHSLEMFAGSFQHFFSYTIHTLS